MKKQSRTAPRSSPQLFRNREYSWNNSTFHTFGTNQYDIAGTIHTDDYLRAAITQKGARKRITRYRRKLNSYNRGRI